MSQVTPEILYDATRDGLDIVLAVVPQAAESFNNLKRKFKLRPDERTASAMLYPPSPKYPYWGVVDYGASEGGHLKSPIDLYMSEKGYGKHDFYRALVELCEQYGVSGHLSSKVNKPEWKEPRPARDDEKEGDIVFEVRNTEFTNAELAVWGKAVEAQHLTDLGWTPIVWWGKVKDGQVKECHSTETYPQFAQRCPYIDNDGNERVFHKIYKPYEPQKQYRFLYSGVVPKDYIFGLDALKRNFHRNDDEKLPYVALVSGGSDAVNCRAMGLPAVCLNSETADMSEETYNTLLKYADKVLSIPDVDATGVKVGKRLALQFINIATLWLPEDIMNTSHDNRGRKRKDLKDYLQLRPSKKEFMKLVDQAMMARFWYFVQDKDGKKHPEISLIGLTYFLWLNNYFTLKDPHAKNTRFVHVEGAVVEEVTIKDIIQFLASWMKKNGIYQNVQDKVLRSKDVSSHIANTLSEVELDFSTGTATSQWFYFENCAVEVTKDAITKHQYNHLINTGRHVWKHRIIPHPYVEHSKMFDITKNDDGTYAINVLSTKSNTFGFYINASRNFWRKELEEQFADRPEALEEYLKTHKFCINGDGLDEEEIREQMQSLVNKIFSYGYLLHSYKVMSRAWAVILYDSRIGTDSSECNGRSGKSIDGKNMKNSKEVFPIEAKNPKITERQFLFAGVTEDTDIVFVDECHKSLDYNFFFGRVTDDFQVERKGIDPFYIPFSKSPKLLIATNYVIKDADSSTEARMLPVVFSDYYHQQAKSNDYLESRSVRDDFGFNLFDDVYTGWDADYAFMLQCEQWYLSVIDGDKKILPPMQNIERRRQKAMLGKRFEDWATDYFQEGGGHLDCKLKFDDVYNNYASEVGHKNAVPQDSFRKKLLEFCEYAEHISTFNPRDITGNEKDGERWRIHETNGYVKYIYIRSVSADKPQPSQPQEPGLWEDDEEAEPF